MEAIPKVPSLNVIQKRLDSRTASKILILNLSSSISLDPINLRNLHRFIPEKLLHLSVSLLDAFDLT